MRIAFALVLLISTPIHAQTNPAPSKAPEVAAAIADGSSAATAIKVSDVPAEYKIARKMNLRVQSQSLVTEGGSYDILNCIDEAGKPRELWFDISSFFPGSYLAK